jgi:plastocyanin
MHAATLQLVSVLGTEKSKVPFFIAGGALVTWALIVSLGLGLRRPDFPGGSGGERIVIAISVVLVLAAVSTAVITSGSPAKTPTASAAGVPAAQTPTGGESSPAPSASSPAASVPAKPSVAGATPAKSPTASTGAPAPPSSPAATAVTALELAADPGGQLSYNTKLLAAKAGKVTITMANMSPIPHNVTVAKGSAVLGATPTFVGASKTLTLSLKPGTYTFYCSVPGHRQAGMEGTLTVSS